MPRQWDVDTTYFWMPYSSCVSSKIHLRTTSVTVQSSTHLIIDCCTGFLSFKLSVSGCSKNGYHFSVLLRRPKIIADIALPNAANQKMSRILKNLINFRNREVLVTDRLQSINLKFYASNQQVNLLFALFIFVLRRKKWNCKFSVHIERWPCSTTEYTTAIWMRSRKLYAEIWP